MKKILSVLIIAVVMLTGCAKKEVKENQTFGPDNKIEIVATIGMIGDVAAQIGGDRVSIYSMMGPGVDPHLYKAKAGDVDRLNNADLVLYNGLHLEAKMGSILEHLEQTRNIRAVTDSIPESQLIEMEMGAHDPHVWFDVQKWRVAANTILAALIQTDPASEVFFTENFQVYDKQMADLDNYIKEQVAALPADNRVLITAHDAFNYFGMAYGFEVLGLQGISTVDEVGTGDVRDLADYIAKNKIAAIFIETSVSARSIKALQAAVQSRGFDVQIGGELFSDAMGNPGTPEGHYLGMVRHNVDTIISGLSQ